MTIWQGSVVIDAPSARVFDYVIERENYHEWFPGIVRMVAEDDEPLYSPSKRYRETAFGPDNKKHEVKCQTLAVSPSSAFSMQADLWPIRPKFRYEFAELGDAKTRFSFTASRGSLNPLAFLGAAVMRQVLDKRAPEALLRLKAILENANDATMQAAEFRDFGAPKDLVVLNSSAPKPKPGPGEVLVRIAASSINPIEPKRARGYGAAMLRFRGGTDWPITLGSDFAGTVESAGDDVRGVSIGDAVFGAKDVGSRGTHAQFTVVPVEQVRKTPANLEPDVVAALPYAWLTAWSALVSDGGIAGYRGRLLVLGGSGGVGMAAIMLANAMDWEVDCTCKSDARELVESFGARRVYAYDLCEPWPSESYDIILDCVGEPDWSWIQAALKNDGPRIYSTLVHPTLALGDAHGALPGLLRAKRAKRTLARTTGLDIRWPVFELSPNALDRLEQELPSISGRVAIDRAFSLCDIANAYEYVELGGMRGKVVVKP